MTSKSSILIFIIVLATVGLLLGFAESTDRGVGNLLVSPDFDRVPAEFIDGLSENISVDYN
jgi:hypothetical protein